MDNGGQRNIADAFLERLPLGVILADTHGQMVYINRTAEKIRKIQRTKLLGKNIVDCHLKTSRQSVLRAMDKILQKPETVFRRMVEDTANNQYYTNTYAGVTDEANQAIGLAILTEDITEKRKAELERVTAYRMMQEASESLKKRYHEMIVVSLETITNLLEKRDQYTSNHSINVCRYALKMYEQRYGIGMDYETLKTAALLHDIGKVGIPDEILKKQGKLTPAEIEVIKMHSVIAADILKPLDTGTDISNIVLHHHEHFDGTGYPDGLRGEDIPVLSRIIAIADAYDAMRSDRPYRKALSYQHAIDEIIKYIGKQFDPEWTKIFLELADTGSL